MPIRTFLLRACLLLALTLSATSLTRAQNLNVEVANMRQDMDLLRSQVSQLQLTVESLQRELGDTRAAAATGKQSYATVNQLHDSIADLNRLIKESNSANKTDILRTVGTQMDKLVKQTNDALDSMAKSVNARRTTVSAPAAAATGAAATTAAAAPTFSDNYPKDGISYTVVSGDSLSKIAKKTGAKIEDIRNANKIANDKALMIGQVLFIPGAKEAAPPAPVSPVAPVAN